MNYFDLQQMTKEDLIAYLKRLSAAYVPEWHMQSEDPDVGSALALIFADMYSDLIRKSGRIPDKHYIDFINFQNPVQKSSKGAQGFIAMTLSEGTQKSVPVARGKQLIGTDSNQEAVMFETVEDVLLTPAKLEAMFLLDAAADGLVMPYDRMQQPMVEPFFVMPSQFAPNLQSHLLTIGHDQLLKLNSGRAIDICFANSEKSIEGKQLLAVLANDELVCWQYQQAGLWLAFEQVEVIDGGIRLCNKAPLTLDAPVVRLELKVPMQLVCEGLLVRPVSGEIEADMLYANEIEVPAKDGYLFGTQYYAYDAFYIANEEVFTKPGSQVTLTLDYILEAHGLPFELPEPQIKWKSVLRKSDLPEIKEKDIRITDLALEYWNGLGWSKLETQVFDGKMFACECGEYKSSVIRFICPNDMAMTQVGASANYWIRLRIMGIENAYTLAGSYLVPKLKRLKMHYAFLNNGCLPQNLVRQDLLTETVIDPKDFKITLFSGYGDLEGKGLYLMFDEKLEGAPIQMLFDVGTVQGHATAKYRWEMLVRAGEGSRWERIEVVDDSRHFTQTGILTLIGDDRHAKTTLFGKTGYWLRALAVESGSLPVLINGIYVNAVKSVQKETMISQLFELKSHEYGKTLTLNHKQLESIQVWVDEPYVSENWLKANKMDFKNSFAADGTLEGRWVKWQIVENPSQMTPVTRGYLVDLYEGKVTFGDSTNGYLPDSSSGLNVRVDYAVNQGHFGNVQAFAVTRLAEAVPNVNKIYNPLAFIGGKPPESRQDALARTANQIHHGNRVRTLKDLDDILIATEYEIREVLTLQDINPEGAYQLGVVTSAIHAKQPIPQMDYFRKMRQQLYREMVKKLPCTLMAERNYFIIEPQPVTIAVHFSGIIESMDQYLGVYEAISAQINEYLDTYSGNQFHEGWHIGELPDPQYLISGIQRTQGLKAVSHLVMNAVVTDGYESMEVSLTHLSNKPFVIVQNGVHTIHLGL